MKRKDNCVCCAHKKDSARWRVWTMKHVCREHWANDYLKFIFHISNFICISYLHTLARNVVNYFFKKKSITSFPSSAKSSAVSLKLINSPSNLKWKICHFIILSFTIRCIEVFDLARLTYSMATLSISHLNSSAQANASAINSSVREIWVMNGRFRPSAWILISNLSALSCFAWFVVFLFLPMLFEIRASNNFRELISRYYFFGHQQKTNFYKENISFQLTYY